MVCLEVCEQNDQSGHVTRREHEEDQKSEGAKEAGRVSDDAPGGRAWKQKGSKAVKMRLKKLVLDRLSVRLMSD